MPNKYKTYKNKELARIKRNEQRKKNYNQTRDSAYSAKQRWSNEEITLITSSTLSDREISKKIGRSVQAIQIKRNRIKN